MWIKKKTYNNLLTNLDEMRERIEKIRSRNEELERRDMTVDALEAEIKRLSELLSATTKDCNVGIWCMDCDHIGRDHAYPKFGRPTISGDWVSRLDSNGDVLYCKKHFHEMCPEFERKEISNEEVSR